MKIESTARVLPPLPYAASALAPYIDERTMTLHHDMHHGGYVKALDHALAAVPGLRNKSAEWLLLNLHTVPEEIRTAVRNNAGGHLNHSLLWAAMGPGRGGSPGGPLARAITQAFGSHEQFRQQFEAAGNALFGSGWVWLVTNHNGEAPLQVMTTTGHDTPLLHGLYPVLANDVWEHAYYLQHQNRRADYLSRWWAVVDWSEAERRLEAVRHGAGILAGSRDEPRLRPVA